MSEPSCAAHLFIFNEDGAVPLKMFFSENRRNFPMLAVIIDGQCGETIFDCFDNFQVIRIHCYSSQPRVICTDSRSARATDLNYYTLPVNTHHAFKKVRGHTTAGAQQTMSQILAENELPVLVKFANEGGTVRIDSCTQQVRNLGNLLIREKYEENYLMVNCIDGTELKMNSTGCLMSLSDKMTATPITGIKNKSKEEYNAFLLKLQIQVNTNGEVYDKTKGNPDMTKYSKDDDTTIYSALELNLEHPAPLEDSDESTGDYEEPFEPPELPARAPRKPTSGTASTSNFNTCTQQTDKSQDNKQNKKVYSLTGFFKSHDKKKQSGPPPPPVPKKPQCEEKVKRESKFFKKNKKPYENTGMPQAVVKPITKPQGTTNITQRKAQPLPITEDEDEDSIYEETEPHSDEDKGCAKRFPPLPPVPASIPHRTVHTANDTLRAKCKRRSQLPINEPSIGQKHSQSQQESTSENTKSFNINEFTIDQVAEALHWLKLDKYEAAFREEQLDGEILANITVDDMMNELHMGKLESVRLSRFIKSGHVPR